MRRLKRVGALALAVTLAVLPAMSAAAAPNPRSDQWWFRSWAIQDGVWQQTKGAGVTVALLDSGVNAKLGELKDAVAAGFQDRPARESGLQDTDADNGGHGTGMASLIGARGGGRTGFVGVAPEAKILSFIRKGDEHQDAITIRHAVDRGARVISMSFGSAANLLPNQCPEDIKQAVAYAVERDVVLIAAAGNRGDSDNVPEFPASCPGVVAIGAVDGTGKIWPKSQRQDYLTLAAPGWQVPAVSKDGGIIPSSGTSNAAALAAGAVALMRAAHPEMKGREVVRRLIGTALDVGPKGKDNQTGFGVVRIRRALTEQVPANTPNPSYERLDQWLAQPKKASPSPSVYQPSVGDGWTPSLLQYAVIGVVAVTVTGGSIALLAMRSRRRRAGSSSSARPPAAGPPPGWGTGAAEHPPAGGAVIQAPYGRASKQDQARNERGRPGSQA